MWIWPVLWLNLAAPALAAIAWAGLGWWQGLGTLFVAQMAFLVPSLVPGRGVFGRVTSRFETAEKEVWVTVDDGPCVEDDEGLRAALREHGARVSFFLIGRRAELLPELVRGRAAEGHEICNHSWGHPAGSWWLAGPVRAAREIGKCGDVLEAITGSRPGRFRSPVGMVNPFVALAAARAGLEVVCWSRRAFDTRERDVERVVARLLRGLAPGSVLLLHEGVELAGGGRLAPRVMRRLLEELGRRGYRCVIPGQGAALGGNEVGAGSGLA